MSQSQGRKVGLINPTPGRQTEVFIETAPRDWDERYAAWAADHSQPCPQPVGHRMFRYPSEYDCEPVED